jgi:hypothetical protein
MADITVRKIRFAFDEPIRLEGSPEEIGSVLPTLGLSMTMPYLEPYLIRTMKVAIKQITDPVLAEDARHFSQQEGHHYRNHAVFNEQIRDYFDSDTADELRRIERDLEADYQRFSKQKSLRWNVAYAEGFEAMTCAGALAMAEAGAFSDPAMLPGGEIWAWHMAEEIEHRTVAFEVFEHLVGSYFYRILCGTWAQVHYIGYIGRFARCMGDALGCKPGRPAGAMGGNAIRNYLRTWSPWYHPRNIQVPAGVDALLAKYSALAERAA